MKTNIHPQYFTNAKVVCACGNTFTTGSTKAEMHVEICSNCHPFFTGRQNLIDVMGKVDKFRKRASKAMAKKSEIAERKLKKAAKPAEAKVEA